MAIIHNPQKGHILMCDFSQGFRAPEMIKERPVVVFRGNARSKLVTIIPLSTREPEIKQAWHMLVSKMELPNIGMFNHKDSWLKADMVYTVGWHRLSLIQIGRKNGKRQYYHGRLSLPNMKELDKCVIHGIGLGRLEKYV